MGPENVITRAIQNTPQDTLDKYGGKLETDDPS